MQKESRRGRNQIKTLLRVSQLKSTWEQKAGCDEGPEDWVFANAVDWNERNLWRNPKTAQKSIKLA